MTTDGSNTAANSFPLWVLIELTYNCPLQCVYCSNPTDFALQRRMLPVEQWIDVLQQARQMGAAQLGFSGGEPLLYPDLVELVAASHEMGYYTNLITSSVGMDEAKLAALQEAKLDHIQISFQASSKELNDFIGASDSFEHKVHMAKLFKKYGFPVVLNIVIHRHNIDFMSDILDMAVELGADSVELANAQYYGFAMVNRDQLLPTQEQLDKARAVATEYQEKLKGKMEIFYVVPDYFSKRPKACMNGWATTFLTLTPDGTALPCHAARVIPDIDYPNATEKSLEWIWKESPAFNAFRGYEWMKDPCKTCPEKTKDFGGCRCQAYMLTGDARNADPVCEFSPHRHLIDAAIQKARQSATEERFLTFRNPSNSRQLS